MNYRRLIYVFVLGLIFSACSKDDDKKDSGESYNTDNTLTIDQLAIYTASGINTDPTLIQGYLDRNFDVDHIKKWFYVGKTSVTGHDIGKTLDFLENNMVNYNGKKMEIVSKTDTLMLIAELDSTNVPTAPGINLRCEQLLSYVPAITPTTYCASNTCKKYRKTYPIGISGGNYYLPTLYFAVTYRPNGDGIYTFCGSVSQEYPMLNFVKKDLASYLVTNDTILVQTGRLPLIKR